MEKEYIFGYLPSEADKMTLDEIYTYLIDKGVIDNTVSKNDLAIILEGVIKSITPDMIRGNVTIAGVTGNVATKVEEIYVDKFDEVEIPANSNIPPISYTFDYDSCRASSTFDTIYTKVTSTNGIDSYAVDNDDRMFKGTYYKNLVTGEKTTLPHVTFKMAASAIDNGDVYVSDAGYSAKGLYLLRGPHMYTINTSSISSSYNYNYNVIYKENIGVYAYKKSESVGFYYINDSSFTVTRLFSVREPVISFTDDFIYVSSSGLYKVKGTSYSNIYNKGSSWKYVGSTPIGNYFISSSSNGVLLEPFDSNVAPYLVYETGQWTYSFIVDNTIYLTSSKSNTLGILKLSIDGAELIYSLGYNYNYFILENNNVYFYGDTTNTKGIVVYNGTDTILIYPNFYGKSAILDENNKHYIVSCNSKTPGIVYIQNENAPLIHTQGFVSNSAYYIRDSKNRLYAYNISSSPGVYYIANGEVHQLSTTTTAWSTTILYTSPANDEYLLSNAGIMYLDALNSAHVTTKSITAAPKFTYTDTCGNFYISQGASSSNGLILLNKDKSQVILTTGYMFVLFESSNKILYIGAYNTNGMYYIDLNSGEYTPVLMSSRLSITYAFGTYYNRITEYPNGDILIQITQSPITDDSITSMIHMFTFIIRDFAIYHITVPSYGSYLKTVKIDNYEYIHNTMSSRSDVVYTKNITTGEVTFITIPNIITASTRIDNRLFISTSSYWGDTGILYIENGVLHHIHIDGYGWNLLMHNSEGDIYVSNTNSNMTGIYHIDTSGNCEKIYTQGYSFNSYIFDEGVVYCTSSSNIDACRGIFKIQKSTASRIYSYGYDYKAFFKASNGDIYFLGQTGSRGSSSYYYLPCLRKDTNSIVECIAKPTSSPNSHTKYVRESNNVIYISAYDTSSSSQSTWNRTFMIKDYKHTLLSTEYLYYTSTLVLDNTVYMQSSISDSSYRNAPNRWWGLVKLEGDVYTPISYNGGYSNLYTDEHPIPIITCKYDSYIYNDTNLKHIHQPISKDAHYYTIDNVNWYIIERTYILYININSLKYEIYDLHNLTDIIFSALTDGNLLITGNTDYESTYVYKSTYIIDTQKNIVYSVKE